MLIDWWMDGWIVQNTLGWDCVVKISECGRRVPTWSQGVFESFTSMLRPMNTVPPLWNVEAGKKLTPLLEVPTSKSVQWWFLPCLLKSFSSSKHGTYGFKWHTFWALCRFKAGPNGSEKAPKRKSQATGDILPSWALVGFDRICGIDVYNLYHLPKKRKTDDWIYMKLESTTWKFFKGYFWTFHLLLDGFYNFQPTQVNASAESHVILEPRSSVFLKKYHPLRLVGGRNPEITNLRCNETP